MKKVLIVWMIFASKLLSSFAVSHLSVSAIYILFSSIYATERQVVVTRDAVTGLHDRGTAPCPMKGGATGAQVPLHNTSTGNFKKAGERWNDGLCHFKSGATGAEVPFHNRIIGNFMVYQDRLETNLLRPFAHT